MVNILTIKAFNDNYIWLIKDSQSKHCIVVDPGDAQPVLEMVKSQNLIIDAILLTHHHSDHCDGVNELLASQECIKVYSKAQLFPDSTLVIEGQTLDFFDHTFSLQIMEMPGHTLDHIVFYNDTLLFCGDTLFSAGCGRLFEGTPQQMHHALNRLAQLDEQTQVYCAHEYTQNNLIFALKVDPKNTNLIKYIKEVSKKRQHGLSTIPTSIGQEKKINPFLRCHQQDLINSLQNELAQPLRSAEECFVALRAYKDHF